MLRKRMSSLQHENIDAELKMRSLFKLAELLLDNLIMGCYISREMLNVPGFHSSKTEIHD